ncbi:MAG: TIGR03943 family protein [Planctomycetes bacterium RBG_16_64_12]|nr:MAG: TIGR03943 family protein [Planctomycetes bacterium RBG_16_64_12]
MAADPHLACERPHGAASARLGDWTDIGTLLVLAAFLGFSFFSGRLGRFLVWPYVWLSPLAALIILAMCAARLVAQLRSSVSCSCQRQSGSPASRLVCAGVFIVPILLALWINPTQFSPEGARKRDVPRPPRDVELQQAINWVLGAKTADNRAASTQVALPESPTILDLLGASEEYLPGQLEGRFVTVVGQCDLPEGAESRRFGLYRLVVTCCIADATAVSVQIARKPGVKLESGGWVRVAGRLKFDNPVDPSLPVIHVAAPISKIPEPSEPYL